MSLVDLVAEKRSRAVVSEGLTDRGHARRLQQLQGDRLAWIPEDRAWAWFDGTRWRRHSDETALEAMMAVSDAMIDCRAEVQDGETWLARLQSTRGANAALEAAKPMLLARIETFDAHPHLLNCPNGTLDLATFELREHDAADRITVVTEAPYDPEAKSELWDEVLKKAIQDEKVRAYVQQLAGLTLAGHEAVDLVVLIYGVTRTGKGTIQGAITRALGEYARVAGLEAFAQRERSDGGPRPELVRLRGTRMLSVHETSQTLRMDAALLKTISGGDPVTVRDMYASPITFVPQFMAWIASNYRPGLPADDDAVWERIREIPFTAQIPEAKRDPTVRERLRSPEHGPAILAWAVQGLRRFVENDRKLETPEAVKVATREYRDSQDLLAGFADEALEFGDRHVFQATPMAIRAALASWIKATGSDRVSADELQRWLEARGCERTQTTGGRRIWRGVGVVSHERGEGDS